MSDVCLTFTMRFYNGLQGNVREKSDVSPWPFAYTVNRYFIKRINKTNLYDCLSLSFSELWVSGIIMTSNFPIRSMSFSRGSRSAMQRRCSYTLTRQIWGIWKLRPAYSPETPNLSQNQWCFVPCDLKIWWMTLENNRASLLCCYKLCATFHSHWWIQTGVTVRKHPIRVKFDDF